MQVVRWRIPTIKSQAMRRVQIQLGVCSLLLAAIQSFSETASYTALDLGLVRHRVAGVVRGINEAGEVVGGAASSARDIVPLS